MQGLALHIAPQIVTEQLKPPRVLDIGADRGVGRDEDVGQPPQCFGRRAAELVYIHIQRGRGDLPVLQSPNQGRLIDQLAPGDIDQTGARLHQPQLGRANELLGLGRPLGAQHDKVAVFKQARQVRRRQQLVHPLHVTLGVVADRRVASTRMPTALASRATSLPIPPRPMMPRVLS